MGNDFTEALKQTFSFEGGYNPRDPSKYGIHQKTLDEWKRSHGLPLVDVRSINKNEARVIYKQQYYEKPGFNKLDPDLARQMFDYGVNMGVGTAIRSLQRIVGTPNDGIIGSHTLTKISEYTQKYGKTALINAVLDDRLLRAKTLASTYPNTYGKYLKTWERRIRKLRPKE